MHSSLHIILCLVVLSQQVSGEEGVEVCAAGVRGAPDGGAAGVEEGARGAPHVVGRLEAGARADRVGGGGGEAGRAHHDAVGRVVTHHVGVDGGVAQQAVVQGLLSLEREGGGKILVRMRYF